MRTLALCLLALAPTAALAKGAPKEPAAGGKVQNACGVHVLPLAEGNQWTYNWVAPKDPATPDNARIAPPAPTVMVITVKSIAPSGQDTIVTLEEKLTYNLTREGKT